MQNIEHLVSSQNQLGEGPIWDAKSARLLWVDITRGAIHSFIPETGVHSVESLGISIGCLALRKDGGLILATQDGFAFWDSGSPRVTPFLDPEPDRPDARFNDGAVDPSGRFWAGTMTPEGANNTLYRLDPDLSLQVMESGVMISNGIGWSPDRSTMYFTDSPRRTIYAYDYDDATGHIDRRRRFVHSPDEQGVPDGLCVDHEGCVWSAQWDGWKIIRYDPGGSPMLEVEMPVQRPTSCAFGGSDLNLLYITSARIDLSERDLGQQPFAGDVFFIETETHGLQENQFLG